MATAHTPHNVFDPGISINKLLYQRTLNKAKRWGAKEKNYNDRNNRMVLFCKAIIHRHRCLVAESTHHFFVPRLFRFLLGQCKINIHSNTIKFIGFQIESLFTSFLPEIKQTKKINCTQWNLPYILRKTTRHSILNASTTKLTVWISLTWISNYFWWAKRF